MLRPWVPLIALTVALALLWQFQPSLLAWGGGGLLVLALGSQLGQKFRFRWRKAAAQRRAVELDWKIIDRSLADERLKQDCERPETLGVCTGRECMVYDTCAFNIKKPLP
jgi:hypothetical protein